MVEWNYSECPSLLGVALVTRKGSRAAETESD